MNGDCEDPRNWAGALRKLEEVFAALEILRPEKGAGEKARLEDAENDDWYSDGDTR